MNYNCQKRNCIYNKQGHQESTTFLVILMKYELKHEYLVFCYRCIFMKRMYKRLDYQSTLSFKGKQKLRKIKLRYFDVH